MIHIKFRGCGPKKTGDPPKKVPKPHQGPPPPPSPIRPIYIVIDSPRPQDSECHICIGKKTCRPKGMLPTPSCIGSKRSLLCVLFSFPSPPLFTVVYFLLYPSSLYISVIHSLPHPFFLPSTPLIRVLYSLLPPFPFPSSPSITVQTLYHRAKMSFFALRGDCAHGKYLFILGVRD